MKLQFLGAAGIVTGSCHMLTINGKKILIDCGQYQGRKETTRLNYLPFKFNPKEISHVLLTHAHIDHSGLIPKLYKEGFKGKIVTTATTNDLCKIMLEDGGHLQEMEAKWDNKRLAKGNKPLREPLYTVLDAKACMKLFKPVDYNKEVDVIPGVKVVFRDAGHIIGSAILEVYVSEGNQSKKIVFSGDLGQIDAPIIEDPTMIEEADYVLIESTYGGRVHEQVDERNQLLINKIHETYNSGGILLIPSFAVERTQEILYRLNMFVEKRLIPNIDIYLDSPLAIKATKVFEEHTECYDKEALDLLSSGDKPFHFPHLITTLSTEESKKLNELRTPAVIIAGSGMCNGGRIKHHIKNHMKKPNTTMLFVGYQAEGTLGRRIRDGAKTVKIYGQTVKMNGKVDSIGGFSAHADQNGLVSWARNFKTNPKFFIVHGEPDSSKALAGKLKELKFECVVPKLYDEVEL